MSNLKLVTYRKKQIIFKYIPQRRQIMKTNLARKHFQIPQHDFQHDANFTVSE